MQLAPKYQNMQFRQLKRDIKIGAGGNVLEPHASLFDSLLLATSLSFSSIDVFALFFFDPKTCSRCLN